MLPTVSDLLCSLRSVGLWVLTAGESGVQAPRFWPSDFYCSSCHGHPERIEILPESPSLIAEMVRMMVLAAFCQLLENCPFLEEPELL